LFKLSPLPSLLASALFFKKIKDIIIDYNFKEIIGITLLHLEF